MAAKKDLQNAQSCFLNAREEYETANRRMRHAEKILEDNRAGILAAALRDGEMCPVCGSIHHPHPAVRPEEAMSETEFEALKKKEKDLSEKKSVSMAAVEKAKDIYESFLQSVRRTADAYLSENGKQAPEDTE